MISNRKPQRDPYFHKLNGYRSGFIQTVHHGKRTKEEAVQFVETIKNNSDGEAPLFLSDGWKPYQDV
jgi:hypothetical protein